MSIIFKDRITIDLSPFQLSQKQIGYILLENCATPTQVTTRSLPGNQAVKADLLEKILAIYPKLQTLQLLNTPQIPLRVKLDLFRGTNIRELLDSEHLARPFTNSASPPLNYIPPPVIQMTFISHELGTEDHDLDRLLDGGLDFQSIFANARRHGTFSCSFPFTNVNRTRTAFMAVRASCLGILAESPFTHALYKHHAAENIDRILGYIVATVRGLQGQARRVSVIPRIEGISTTSGSNSS